jgi:hypothetical protein
MNSLLALLYHDWTQSQKGKFLDSLLFFFPVDFLEARLKSSPTSGKAGWPASSRNEATTRLNRDITSGVNQARVFLPLPTVKATSKLSASRIAAAPPFSRPYDPPVSH